MSFLAKLRRKSTPVVHVIKMSGSIMDAKGPSFINTSTFMTSILRAFDKKQCKGDLKAVALAINSPGGAAGQCHILWQNIRRMSLKHKVPAIAFVEDLAASGGYYLACAAEEIHAVENSIVGSIGVINMGLGVDRFLTRLDFDHRPAYAGKNTRLGSYLQPQTEAGQRYMQGLLNAIHKEFIQAVTVSRGSRLSQTEDLFQGDIWTARKAKELGIIDGIHDLHGYCKEKFGEDVQILEVKRFNFLELLQSAVSTKPRSSLLSENTYQSVEDHTAPGILSEISQQDGNLPLLMDTRFL